MSPEQARCWAVIPAAGIGSRMGAEIPKQYMEVAGASLLEHSVRALLACEQIIGIVVALHTQDTRAGTVDILQDPRVVTVTGAAQRSGSVLAGLEALVSRAGSEDWVLVHDAARPCLRWQDIERLISSVTARSIGGLLAEPVVDTVKQAGADDLVACTVDRDRLWRAQTPQMFRLDELRRALLLAQEQGRVITDEASAMEMAGYPVQLVVGSTGNLKVTVPADLPLAAWYLRQAGESEQA